jgi:hypothetical protein
VLSLPPKSYFWGSFPKCESDHWAPSDTEVQNAESLNFVPHVCLQDVALKYTGNFLSFISHILPSPYSSHYTARFMPKGSLHSALKTMKIQNLEGHLTNYIQYNSSWDANSHWASKGIPCLLWIPKVHYNVHKSLPVDPILRRINPVHIPLI